MGWLDETEKKSLHSGTKFVGYMILVLIVTMVVLSVLDTLVKTSVEEQRAKDTLKIKECRERGGVAYLDHALMFKGCTGAMK